MRFDIESLGESAHEKLGVNGLDDRYAGVATARLVTADGEDCTPVSLVNQAPLSPRPILSAS